MSGRFTKNKKYYTISVYTVIVVTICALIIRLINNWTGALYLLGKAIEMISPFLVGLFIAYLLNPLVELLSNKLFKKVMKIKSLKVRRALAIVVSYIILLAACTTLVVFIVPQIIDSVKAMSELVNTAQDGYNGVMSYLDKLHEKHPQIDVDPAKDFITSLPKTLANAFEKLSPTILITTIQTSVNVISGVLKFLIAFVISIYVMFDKPRLINNTKRFIYSIMKTTHADRLIANLRESNDIFSGFIIGKFIDSLIIGILCFIITSILKTPYPIIISVIVGVTNMIPYFGPFIGGVPSVLFVLLIDFKSAVILAIAIICLQQFDGLILGPKILGDKTGLRPLWVIFAITVGGYVAGVAGMFFGVPVVAVIAHLCEKFMEKRLKKKRVDFATNEETGIMHHYVIDDSVTEGIAEDVVLSPEIEDEEEQNDEDN